ncbi:MAG: hypothetical protein QM796_20075 [Chthoniobacteraceae bacterium]
MSVMVFSTVGTATGFLRTLDENFNSSASLVLGGCLNVLLILFLCLVLFAPIASVVDFLFSQRWTTPIYVEAFVCVGLGGVALSIISLIFNGIYLPAYFSMMVGLMPPLLLYWIIFHMTGRYNRE